MRSLRVMRSLRSIFVAVEGQPHVELLPAEKGLSLAEEDLRGLGDRWERVKQLSREEAGRAFDLSRGPLVRARLIRLEEQGVCFPGDAAPYRFRRVVEGNFCTRNRRVVLGLQPGTTQRIGAAEDSVSRLCRVAAAMAERRAVAEAD